MKPISLDHACASLPELWSPRILAQFNGQCFKVAKVSGDFPWHSHEEEDELFLVLRGALTINRAEADGGSVTLHPHEIFVVPRGMRHSTSAAEETWIALVEPLTTRHTGNEDTPLTRTVEDQLRSLPE